MKEASRLAVPMGDPAGIGPEIAAKSMLEDMADDVNCVVVGDKNVMEKCVKALDLPLQINIVDAPQKGVYKKGVLNLIDMQNIDMAAFVPGKISGICGRAAYEYIEKSIDLAMSGAVDAVATTPINKESLKAGNVNFIGHTEIFAELTKTKDPLTLFQVRDMRVFFLTRHVSLRQACDLVTYDRIVDYVKRCHDALKRLGVKEGTMAVAGLNPHSGENGLFGNEETDHITPAVKALQDEGYDVVGPVPADSVFHMALHGRFNSVLSLYHDQGHIACKTLDFQRTVSITCDMPILRTSVDHGTALDIAWQGKASHASMVEAILAAATYAPHFAK